MSLESRLRALEKTFAAGPKSAQERYLHKVEEQYRETDEWCERLASGIDPGSTPPAKNFGMKDAEEVFDWLVIKAVTERCDVAELLAGEWPLWAPERVRQKTLEFCREVQATYGDLSAQPACQESP